MPSTLSCSAASASSSIASLKLFPPLKFVARCLRAPSAPEATDALRVPVSPATTDVLRELCCPAPARAARRCLKLGDGSEGAILFDLKLFDLELFDLKLSSATTDALPEPYCPAPARAARRCSKLGKSAGAMLFDLMLVDLMLFALKLGDPLLLMLFDLKLGDALPVGEISPRALPSKSSADSLASLSYRARCAPLIHDVSHTVIPNMTIPSITIAATMNSLGAHGLFTISTLNCAGYSSLALCEQPSSSSQYRSSIT